MSFSKIITFSEDPRFHGMVLPRGSSANRSGGSIAMNRALADLVFPIDERLPSEDIWLAHSAIALAADLVELRDIVLEYRIHPGNSNPRGRSFEEMNSSMHERHRAWLALAESSRLNLPSASRQKLSYLWSAEQEGFAGNLLRVLISPGLTFAERASLASMANRALYALRSRFYKLFSGWSAKL